jgi:hypothetical protein
MREALNSKLRQHGYALRWMPPRAFLQANLTIEVGFSLLAAHLMLTTPEPYFIGIGANDGVTHDPLYPFVRDFRWRGIIVEPIPEPLPHCSTTMRDSGISHSFKRRSARRTAGALSTRLKRLTPNQ